MPLQLELLRHILVVVGIIQFMNRSLVAINIIIIHNIYGKNARMHVLSFINIFDFWSKEKNDVAIAMTLYSVELRSQCKCNNDNK